MFDRNSLFEGIGLAAVIASLLFVAFEIRQANRIAVGTTSYELNRNWMTINELYMTNPGVLDLMISLSDEEFAPKDEREREQAEAFARRILNNWVAIEEAYNNGIASEAFYFMASQDVKAVIKKRPGVVPIFATVTAQYDLSDYRLLDPLVASIEARRVECDRAR